MEESPFQGDPITGFTVGADDPEAPDVTALLDAHLVFARAHSPPEDSHALDVEDLRDDDVSLFTVREGGEVIGVGAVRRLDGHHAELKSIHTATTARGRGVGRAMVARLVATARANGYGRVSLETGTMEAFAASRALYRAAGFVPCEPFAGYSSSSYSIYMTLEIRPELD